MFLENARDKVLKNRHHASIPLYCGRNEGNPPKSLLDALPALVRELDGCDKVVIYTRCPEK